MRKRRPRRKNTAFFGIIFVLFVFMGVGYAYLTSNLNINGTTAIAKNTWDVHFENISVTGSSVATDSEPILTDSNTKITFTVALDKPGDFYEFTVDVINSGTIDAMLSDILNTGLTTDEQKYLEYIVSYEDGVSFTAKDSLKAGAKDSIKVIVKYKDDITAADLPTDDKLLTLTLQTMYVQSDKGVTQRQKVLSNILAKNAVADNTSSTYVTSSTGIDFSKISSDTNGKGIYLLASTKDDTNPIYYYRGAVTNNNVKFAGFCWKIVRTTETGGVKLIYNGAPDGDGYCTNTTGTSTQIGTSAFNSTYDANRYVGYMYGAESGTYEEQHANTTSSTIKTTIDNWYQTNMTAYTEKLEDTVWCNDRSLSSGSGTGTTETYYGARDRLYINKTPSLVCPQENDKFTVSEENGNGDLTYPVALLTADEVAYAGGVYYNSNGSSDNSTYYLYTNQYYWSLSPFTFNSIGAVEFNMTSNGVLVDYYVNTTFGVRPAVSLAPNTTVTGDGTSNSPYVVE